ncbi:MAG TPA: ABC transporter permease subunit [Steroidobacteraceae bacterium]|nr:ABC transporter permease subunit [Steroidobacteraceae bacterium]
MTPARPEQRPESFAFIREHTTRWDLIALVVVIGLMAFFADASHGLFAPLKLLEAAPMSLDPVNLPFYAARTTFRMFAALAVSLLFTFTYATWAAKSARAEKLLVPILDILQSVPILGFISITVIFFMSLVPGRVLGAEFVAIFAIFTSQAWNMAFSFYQSLRTVPVELQEAAVSFRLSPWMRFWQLEVPFAMPALIWNMMMSMSGGWFFVVASESFTVKDSVVSLPGIGSYIALAIEQRDLTAVGWAIATMVLVILAYDQLIFRPLIAWADRFRIDQEPGAHAPQSWALKMLQQSRLVKGMRYVFRTLLRSTARRIPVKKFVSPITHAQRYDRWWLILIVALIGLALWHLVHMLITAASIAELLQVTGLAAITMLRVFVLIALASLIWVPIGVWVGLRPGATAVVQPIAQFLAAFPSNLLFPVVVFGVVRWHLHPDIWLSPLMILGTQWYILFNVIAGASALPNELRDSAANFGVKGWLWWRRVALPGVFPYYVTGAITASGGSWNASIAAEIANWGSTQVQAHGIGAYIAKASASSDLQHVMLGIAVMSVFVLVINRSFWRPLYYFAERKFRLT